MTVEVVIGDVHGEAGKLRRMIDLCKERYGDDILFYCTGDLIDRGPDSRGVLDICVEEGVISCMGNHEYWLWEYLTFGRELPVTTPIWGTRPTFESYGAPAYDFGALARAMPESHKEYISSLQLVARVKVPEDCRPFWLTHSGLPQSVMARTGSISVEDHLDMLVDSAPHVFFFSKPRFRSYLRNNVYAFPDDGVQIFGHQIVGSPMVTDHYIALDTGCGTTDPNMLSAVVLNTMETVSVS
tara:strand:- start:6738 stop:7460 length:723 start_codon:yes stop_codon:yes gene_type:complete